MMIRIASAAAIAALMSTAAFAQPTNPPPATPEPAAPMAQPAPAPAPMAQPAPAPAPMTKPAPESTAPMATPMTNAKILTTLPSGAVTVTNYYKQSVYDNADNKIGTVDDVLVTKEGKIDAAMIGVGGFLGLGEKDVAVPFEALQLTQKNNKWYLTMNSTKDELKSAPGFKYDRNTTTWMPAKSASNATPMNDAARK